jgi:hypothetical protein
MQNLLGIYMEKGTSLNYNLFGGPYNLEAGCGIGPFPYEHTWDSKTY